MTNSEKTGYKKNPRAIYGPDFVEKTRSRAAVEMTVRTAQTTTNRRRSYTVTSK